MDQRRDYNPETIRVKISVNDAVVSVCALYRVFFMSFCPVVYLSASKITEKFTDEILRNFGKLYTSEQGAVD